MDRGRRALLAAAVGAFAVPWPAAAQPKSKTRLVLLGNFLGRSYPFVSQTLQAELDRRALPATRRVVRVMPASLGIDAPLLGAAELAFEPLLTDPAAWLHPRRSTVVTLSA